MPTEPSANWWPIAVIAVGIVGIGAVWFTQWVIGRLERDRSKLHEHGTTLTVHALKIEELREDVDDLTEKDPHGGKNG